MIDPYTALGAASAIVQFVQFGATVLEKAYTIHKTADGSLGDIRDLESAASRMQALSSQLDTVAKDGDVRSSVYDSDAAKLAADCEKLAEKVLKLLREIDIQGQPGKLRSVQYAVKLERRKPALAVLEKEMGTIRGEAMSFILQALCMLFHSRVWTFDFKLTCVVPSQQAIERLPEARPFSSSGPNLECRYSGKCQHLASVNTYNPGWAKPIARCERPYREKPRIA